METKAIYYDYSSYSKILMDIVLIFGPNLAFISQIAKFRSSNSSEGFSKKISLLILTANILRIFFWYGKRFDISLLFQSIVSIIMQIVLLEECLRASREYSAKKKFVSNSFKNIGKNSYGEQVDHAEDDNDDSIHMNEFEFIEPEHYNKNNINENEEVNLKQEDEDIELKLKNIKNFGKEAEKEIINNKMRMELLQAGGEGELSNYSYNNKESSSSLNIGNNCNNNKLKKVEILYENKNAESSDSGFLLLSKLGISNKIKQLIENNSLDDILNVNYFWNWPYLLDYLFFCIFFSIIIFIIFSVFGIQNKIFIEIIGYLALVIESTIGIPQIIENYKNKTTKNLSFFMIFIWLTGDTLKTLYFLKFKAPIQFIICGLFQMIIDCSIIFQINYYRTE